tara:strand:+ start:2090 stop:2206 length:117 start_codon:yes stop_codon:yes gene_type:complete
MKKQPTGNASAYVFGVKGKVANTCPKVPGNFGNTKGKK